MHHFIYPQKDTYITNQDGLDSKNFGITEILQVGTSNVAQHVMSPTMSYAYTDISVSNQHFDYFIGIFTGSFSGTVEHVDGMIQGNSLNFSASYFSGSVDSVSTVISGSVSGSSIDGYLSGSVIAPVITGIFTGQITGSTGCLTGVISGYNTIVKQNWTTVNKQFSQRTLLQFDLTEVSESIVIGDIVNPAFSLKLKIARECELPITYSVYAYPLIESWVMGDGYASDCGSDNGASWNYRDINGGTSWSTPGGAWEASKGIVETFEYQTSDINMDITPIVMSWISGSVPNYGVILISSDELLPPTGSGFSLKYFSRDTNTIYSPVLDVKWDDVAMLGYVTGSLATASVNIVTGSASISCSTWTGTLDVPGGVNGVFSGSSFIQIVPNYITASNQVFDVTVTRDTSHDIYYAAQTLNSGYFTTDGPIVDGLGTWRYYTNITDGAIGSGYDTYGWGNYPLGLGVLNVAKDVAPQNGIPDYFDILAMPTASFTLPQPIYGNTYVRQFTGSFTGSFQGSASYVNGTISGSEAYDFFVDYFSGSIDGVSTQLNNSEIYGSSSINGLVSGSIATAEYLDNYLGTLTSPQIMLHGTGSGYYLDLTYNAYSGFVAGGGMGGNIVGLPVYGYSRGFVTVSESVVQGPCGNVFTTSFASGSFLSGPFQGCTFTGFYVDYKFENCFLTGSWCPTSLIGAVVNIPIPSGIDPYVYAYITGTFVNGAAIGTYQASGSNSASFNGQFINGPLVGGYVNLQLTGSVFTSSYAYTASVTYTSSLLTSLDTGRPFSINLDNVQPTYKAGDIAKLGVFGRKKFPLKYFGMTTQQTQYLIPEFLPTSSYYAIKDNETEEMLVNFDSYTRIGCEYPNGNYFLLDTTGLPQDRYYRVLIRVEDGNTIRTFDIGKTFKIVR